MSLLKYVPNLRELSLSDASGVTDAGLSHLLSLSNLRELNLSGAVSSDLAAEIDALRAGIIDGSVSLN